MNWSSQWPWNREPQALINDELQFPIGSVTQSAVSTDCVRAPGNVLSRINVSSAPGREYQVLCHMSEPPIRRLPEHRRRQTCRGGPESFDGASWTQQPARPRGQSPVRQHGQASVLVIGVACLNNSADRPAAKVSEGGEDSGTGADDAWDATASFGGPAPSG